MTPMYTRTVDKTATIVTVFMITSSVISTVVNNSFNLYVSGELSPFYRSSGASYHCLFMTVNFSSLTHFLFVYMTYPRDGKSH